MKLGIITPTYMAWDKVKKCISHIDNNTYHEYHHVIIDDSSPNGWNTFLLSQSQESHNRTFYRYEDGLPANKHRANITTALQIGYEMLKTLGKFDYIVIIESDVMVPLNWDKIMIDLSSLLPNWIGLEAFAVDELGRPEYPMTNNPAKRIESHGGMSFELVEFCDFNCILLNPNVLDEKFKFDSVPSHHDILLCRKWKDKFPGWQCYRTREVSVVHYPNSSRSQLPEGLNTPSNP